MKGVLIYGFNNQHIDYFKQSVWCADRVKRHLGLPVTIITDESSVDGRSCEHDVIMSSSESGGTRVFNPGIDSTPVAWLNASRYQSWDLSPYSETIVLDSDYIVCSPQLLTLFGSGFSVTAMKHVYDITNQDSHKEYQFMSAQKSLHHYWATVMYFKKDDVANDFFVLMRMIRENYQHYCDIYKLPNYPFRNDFAVSIALNTLYGHRPDLVPEIPWAMASEFNNTTINQVSEDCFELTYEVGPDKKPHRVRTAGQDFHYMNKRQLATLYED